MLYINELLPTRHKGMGPTHIYGTYVGPTTFVYGGKPYSKIYIYTHKYNDKAKLTQSVPCHWYWKGFPGSHSPILILNQSSKIIRMVLKSLTILDSNGFTNIKLKLVWQIFTFTSYLQVCNLKCRTLISYPILIWVLTKESTYIYFKNM